MPSRIRYTSLPASSVPTPSPSRSRPPFLPRALHLLRRLIPIVLAFTFALLSLLAAYNLWQDNTHPQFMRLCLPFNVSKVSTKAHSALACTQASSTSIVTTLKGHNMSTSATGSVSGTGWENVQGGRLADFLTSQKEAFLRDLKDGKGKGWVVAMGNAAGDLDTLASSISYATLASTLLAERSVPLILTKPKQMRLRPENLVVLTRAKVPSSALLYSADLPVSTDSLADLGVKFALVDHNSLLPPFRKPGEDQLADESVTAILDHHADDGHHKSASPRVIKVTGSSASLVTVNFMEAWKAANAGPAGTQASPVPQEISTLLMSSILIDTGLKAPRPGKEVKTKDDDRTAASFLWPLSDFRPAFDTAAPTPSQLEQGDIPAQLVSWDEQISEAKSMVQGLTGVELLMRDYKDDTITTKSGQKLKVGFSTVPMGLPTWLSRKIEGEEQGWPGLMDAVDTWMGKDGEGQDLDVEIILTTFKGAKEADGKAKSQRELMVVVKAKDGGMDKKTAEKVFHALCDEMKAAQTLEGQSTPMGLDLKKWGKGMEDVDTSLLESGKKKRFGKVWRQGNTGATRKQVLPLVQKIIAGIE